MEIVYSLINFAILIAIIAVIFAKGFIKSLKDRRAKINKDLSEAENPVLPSEPCNEVHIETTPAVVADTDTKYALEDQKQDTELQNMLNGLRIDAHEKQRSAAIKSVCDKVAETMVTEPYLSEYRKNEHDIAEAILSIIKLTPGDLSYLVKHNVLYVTLTSAFPLDQMIVDCVDWATESLLKEVGGKKSFWVKTDPKLIGGLTLRIGDTIYDGSIAELLYQYKQEMLQKTITAETTQDDIITQLAEKAKSISKNINVYQLGRAIKVSDGICWLDGLADIMYGEVVEFDCGEKGMILDIQADKIGCIVFGKFEKIESGNRVRRLGRTACVPVGEYLLGRVVDALGNPLDGMGKIWADSFRPIENPAPAITDRQSVKTSLHTGIKAIDALVPIGKGQRELIIGDRQTGKSAIAIDAIINQKGQNVICIYVAIGQKDIYIADLYSKLKKAGAMDYTVIVSADAFSSASMQYIAPFAATSMGEYYMYNGKDVLIIYDDLSKHAVAYRELSLLLQRPSGREAYPGDVFYLHARLLERSARLSDELGGGSMTALPMIETQAGDISAYIPTNTISITDGQIFLDTELFNEGQRPAINVGLSVSRVGGSAQTKLLKQVSAGLRTSLAQYRELQSFAQFGADLDEASRAVLDKGARMMAVLKQPRYSPMSDAEEALVIYAVSNGFADKVDIAEIEAWQKDLIAYFKSSQKETYDLLCTGKKLDKEQLAQLSFAITAFAEAM